ncbi:hypothetical protein DFH27DRAFT_533644 [Peziza echinospora]|nr:hypothetical protein DFH27DRAFT_533644 [Peziza echinospora]
MQRRRIYHKPHGVIVFPELSLRDGLRLKSLTFSCVLALAIAHADISCQSTVPTPGNTALFAIRGESTYSYLDPTPYYSTYMPDKTRRPSDHLALPSAYHRRWVRHAYWVNLTHSDSEFLSPLQQLCCIAARSSAVLRKGFGLFRGPVLWFAGPKASVKVTRLES